MHGPAAAGDCIACHDPHTSPNQYQLIAAGNDPRYKYTCHVDKKDEVAAGHRATPAGGGPLHELPQPARLAVQVPAVAGAAGPLL